ncbi:hypothetical protein ITJ86_15480 [Winogradskyella sp. F6397]|uniref:phospholipase D n=1 Tax=Winogradskyella marina TaxID=2785530 RepID=A0ABS0ELZ7_9FLAO|nr:phospholipase D-like domain-containing protein [Winogradskyella marina]MBF8151308.1 hypothetical protein [Winogradskyella marina]
MENEIYFKDIQAKIIHLLDDAKEYIWLAVAWITDKKILSILEDKIKCDVDVKIIVMDDEFNRDYFLNIEFLIPNENIFFRESHHKYCIIDDEVLITGSYNWTNKAIQRVDGENVLVTYSKNNITEAKRNFISILGDNSLMPKKEVEIKTKTDFYILKAQELSYGETVSENKIAWWHSLSYDWKVFFIEEVCSDFGTEDELDLFYNQLKIEQYDDDFYYHWEVEKIEKYSLHEFLILILNIVNMTNPIELDCELESEVPLLSLDKLKNIKKITFKTLFQFNRLINYNQNLTISNICILESISSDIIPYDIAARLERINMTFNEVNEKIINKFKKSASYINLYSEKEARIDIQWFSGFKNLKALSLSGFSVNGFYHIENIANSISEIYLKYCRITDADKDFILEMYPNLYIDYTSYFLIYTKGYLYELEQELDKQRDAVLKLQDASEYKYFDNKGNRYKYVEDFIFKDRAGNTFNFFGNVLLRDSYGNFVNEDGSVSPF